jgi:glycosyltransferase involved in cell wall biosynthesis
LPRRAAPTGVWTLGTVALYRPRKGLEVLLDALAHLKSQGLPVHLRAVGTFESADYEAKIKARVEQLDLGSVIDWRGFQRDVNRELAAMDLLVLPSLFGEGLPMVILEAMAAGVPVVGTRVEGVPEAIRDGQDGLIAAPGDAAGLARAIEQVVRGAVDWAALRESAHQRQAEQFSDASMAAGVAAVYDAVLCEQRKRKSWDARAAK